MIREIWPEQITEAVASLCVPACEILPEDVSAQLRKACGEEPWPPAAESLQLLWRNELAAAENHLPICQDTGAACVFLEIGTDVHIIGNVTDAVNAGIRKGYTEGYLRSSIAADPLRRGNTGDNTPAFLTTELVPGSSIRITLLPKGFGSENMSALKMLKPSDGVDGVVSFVLDTVRTAGSNPCPPVVLGVGIGATFDKVALLAKKALLRPIGESHPDPFYAELEQRLLKAVNATGIGPQGFGGKTTCLGVAIEKMPTHVAGLPVAVNVSCHALRRKTVEI